MNKKRAIIATVIFIVLGLTVYAFANPNEETQDEGENNNVKYNVENEDNDNENKQLLEEDVANNNNTQNTNNVEEAEEAEEEEDNTLAVLALVIKAEGSLEKEDYDKALEETNKLTEEKEELLNRLEKVKDGINTISLVNNLVKLVNESNDKDDINDARDFNTSNEIENKINVLTNEKVKTLLLTKMTSVKPVLNDNNDPVINIEDNAVLKTVLINVDDDSELKLFLSLNETENLIDNNTEVNTDGKYLLRAVDKSFNTSNVKFTIDNVKPTFNVTNGSHSSSNVNVVVTDDNFDYAVIYLDGVEKSTQTINTFELNEEGTYRIVAYDKAGNSNTLWTAIDSTNPVISGVSDNEFYNTDVTIVVTDKYLTKVVVNGTIYNRNNFTANANNENFRFELTLSEEGSYTIDATDKVGNTTSLSFVIDKTAATIGLSGTEGLNQNEMRIEAGITLTLDDIKATVTDNFDNATVIEPYKADFLIGTASENEYNYDFSNGLNTRRRGGRYNVYYRYTDAAGNKTEKTMLVVISDTTAPTITLKGSLGRNQNEMHVNSGITITLDDIKATVTDNADDTTSIEPYKVDFLIGTASENEYNYDFSNGLNTKRSGGRYNVYYRYTDAAGNKTEKSMMVLIFDVDAPSLEANGTTSTSHDTLPFTITLKFNEKVQVIDGWTYGNDKTELKKEFSSETTENLEVKDLAGNITNIKLKTNRLKGDVVATIEDDEGNITPYSNFFEIFLDL